MVVDTSNSTTGTRIGTFLEGCGVFVEKLNNYGKIIISCLDFSVVNILSLMFVTDWKSCIDAEIPSIKSQLCGSTALYNAIGR